MFMPINAIFHFCENQQQKPSTLGGVASLAMFCFWSFRGILWPGALATDPLPPLSPTLSSVFRALSQFPDSLLASSCAWWFCHWLSLFWVKGAVHGLECSSKPVAAHTVSEIAAVASHQSQSSFSQVSCRQFTEGSRSGSCRRHQGNAFPGLSLQPPQEVSEQGQSPAPGAAADVSPLQAWACILGSLRKAAEPIPDAHANVLV